MTTILGEEIGLPLVALVESFRSHSANRISWHSHPGYEFIFFLDGSTAYEFEEGPLVEVHGGDFLMVPPGIVHRGLHDVRMPSTICVLRLNPGFREEWRNTTFKKHDLDWMVTELERSGLAIHRITSDLKRLLGWLMEAKAGLESDPSSGFLKASLRIWACATLLSAVRELGAPRSLDHGELVVAAKEYLRKNLANSISMSDMVKHIGLGRSRMFDLFKSVTGMTPNDYLLRLRVEKAQELLANSSQSITDIALTSGFSSCQYFDNVFRKYTGQTPQEFRKGLHLAMEPESSIAQMQEAH